MADNGETSAERGVLAPGTVISGFRIERELGRGAMAIVYLATQLDLDRPVAFKVMSAELAADREFVSRFVNEARAAAALNHPSIIQAYQVGELDGQYFFCMEYVDGETLLQMIRREGRIPLDKALEWFRQIAEALQYGWELHRFTHGDIKPENIMINSRGQAKLADFGLARVDGHDYAGQTVMLTPLYAPPELIRGEKFIDECRPDIYAYGASLYHALAGTPPFPGTDAQTVVQRQLHEPLEPLSHRNPEIPQALSDLVGRMLVKEMSARLGSWQAVIDGLRQCQQGLSSRRVVHAPGLQRTLRESGERAAVLERQRQGRARLTWTLVGLGGVTLAALAGGAFLVLGGASPEVQSVPPPSAPSVATAPSVAPSVAMVATVPVAPSAPSVAASTAEVPQPSSPAGVPEGSAPSAAEQEQTQVEEKPEPEKEKAVSASAEPSSEGEPEVPEGHLRRERYQLPVTLDEAQRQAEERLSRLVGMATGRLKADGASLDDAELAALLSPEHRGQLELEVRAWGEWQELRRASVLGSVELMDRKLWSLLKGCPGTALMRRLGGAVTAVGERCKGMSRFYAGRHLLQEVLAQPAPRGKAERQEQMRQLLWLRACFGRSLSEEQHRRLQARMGELDDRLESQEGLGTSLPEVLPLTGFGFRREPLLTLTAMEAFGRRMKSNKRLKPIEERLRQQLGLLARLDMGDWAALQAQGAKRLTWRELERLELDMLPEAGRRLAAETQYAKGLLEWRLDDDAQRVRRQAERVEELASDWRMPGVSIRALALELRLLGRVTAVEGGPFALADESSESQADELSKVPSWMRRRLVCLWLTYRLERGESSAARSMLEMLSNDSAQAELYGFGTEVRQRQLSLWLQLLDGDLEPLGEPSQLAERELFGESLWVTLSCLCDERLDGLQEPAMRALFERALPQGRVALGEALLAWVERRVAHDLRKGELGYALETVEWALSRRESCLFPCLGRLMGLRAGLLLLHGLRGGAVDAGMLAQGATVLSPLERTLLELAAKGRLQQPDVSAEMARKGVPAAFWHAWLVACERLGARGARAELADAASRLRQFGKGLSQAERCLGETLAGVIDRRLERLEARQEETTDSTED
ncbi:MAG: protein kinase [Oligosphaeraceae bacterium]